VARLNKNYSIQIYEQLPDPLNINLNPISSCLNSAENNLSLIKEILLTRNTKIVMVNLFEFKIIGHYKSFSFKLLDTMKNVIEWIKIVEGMVIKINKKMNDLKLLSVNQVLNIKLGSKFGSNKNSVNKKDKNRNIDVEKKEFSFSSSLNNNVNNDIDKILFQISESQEDR